MRVVPEVEINSVEDFIKVLHTDSEVVSCKLSKKALRKLRWYFCKAYFKNMFLNVKRFICGRCRK